MSADAGLADPAAARNPARDSRLFFTLMAVACLITVVAGFGPTYFFKPFRPSPPLSPLLHAHGMVFTGWVALMILQTGLVRADRLDLHRRLGLLGTALAVAVVALGISVALDAARHGTGSDGMTPLAFMIFPLGQVLLFAGFVGTGLWNRRRPELHRRLMLLGTISMLTPALSRIVGKKPVLALFLTVGFVVVAMIQDWRTRRRVHPVYIAGGLILLVSGPLRAAIGNSTAWQSFAHWLVG